MVTNIEEITEHEHEQTPAPSCGIDPSRPESWPLWMNVGEVAAVLRLSLSTIRFLHASGKLRGRKFGHQVRWQRDQVMKCEG